MSNPPSTPLANTDPAPTGTSANADRAPTPAELGDLFLRLNRRLRRATMVALEPCGVSPHQARALRAVVRHGRLRPSRLAELLGIALRSTTQVVDDLVAAGLLDRRPDPDDRRAVLVAATAAGTELADRIATQRTEAANRFLGVLTQDDRAELHRILSLLDDCG